ncbi:GntR family transcriptional regulator [Serinicoccus chungangensis]|uniref:GntR family transcriptional regulator n=1 Tax=Serinicoccus chungangensis TaxID=767452 RepID=A0A0W8I6Y5_9MICO|nr:GntR family transcriptional regulator [Serinicoccus chungangensis]KUG54341.1 GntR family transcriptional regulator [Serinicoccus chungangensis]
MSLSIAVDPGSPTPVFEQVVERVVEAVREGALVPGDRLPPVRRLAADLGIATNTVAKAYRQLEEEGHVETRGRGGTVVRDDLAPVQPARVAAEELVRAARASGLDLSQTVGLLRRSW